MKIFFRFALRLVVGAIIGATIGAAIGACCILGWANLQAPASKLSYSSFEKWAAGQNLRTSILSDLPNGAITGIMIGGLSGFVLAWRREQDNLRQNGAESRTYSSTP
jgi:glycerol uptake facilitator-like aquaporin